MWRGEVRRGRAGQAFDFGEPGVLDGATAKSLAAGRHGPRQVGQIVKTKPLTRSCLRIWIGAWSHASPLFKQPAA